MLISIAIPCYRSSLTIRNVVEEIKEKFAEHPEHDYQIVLVNDGSPDNTFDVIRELCEADKKIVGVNLSRNYTQANAKMAALPYIDGDVAVIMDDDGQHPPEEIFRLVDKVVEGFDVVYAYFVTKTFSWFKIVTSDILEKLCEIVGNSPKGLKSSSFYALSRFCVNRLKEYHSPYPEYLGYLYQITTRITYIPMNQRERIAGSSGYTLRKMFALAIICLTNFTIVPLRIFAWTGSIVSVFGIIYAIVMIIRKLIHPQIMMGYTSIMSAILVIGGIILLGIGLLGEYLGKVYMTLSNQPQYTVREVLNSEEKQ